MRKVIVTGGSRGIGLGLAKCLVEASYRVIVISRSRTPELEAALATHGALTQYGADLSNLEMLGQCARTLRANGPIYGLVNNAGIGSASILATMKDSQIADVMTMNVVSPITLTKYLLRSMMTANEGRIINIASIVASTGYPGLSVYGASKSAILGFTRSLAREVGPLGITVNAISPGFIATEMTHGLDDKQRQQIARRSALHRMATVADVAASVEFLMSEKAANITGTNLTVDAGNTA